MPKVLLSTLNSKYIHLNLAIRILYDLNHEAHDLSFKEFTIKQDLDEVAQYCVQFDIVCLSCYIWNITPSLVLAEKIKQLRPETKILLGGPEVSYEWENVIAQDAVDYIITGEGEIPFETFLQHFPAVEAVPNLVYKKEGQILHNKQNVEFDVQRFEGRNPYQYDPVEDLKHKISYVETSRGCPYKCSFCLASLDNSVRKMPLETLKENLKYLMQHGKVIKFLDRTFNIKKDFTISIFQFLLDHHHPHNIFQFEITADIIHPDIIQFIHENVPKGLFRFEIGIQTVNKESNLAVERKQNFEKTANVIKQLDTVVEMHLDLIVGLPLEYLDDIKFSFESVFKLYPPELQLGFLKFLKGTGLRNNYQQYDYVFDPNPPYQIIKSKFLTPADLELIILVEHALEIYWNKKRAVHSLRYIAEKYSIFDTLLGIARFFETHTSFLTHTLKEIYEVLFQYFKTQFQDPILLDLLAIDYYTYYKVKPQDLFAKELDKAQRFELITAQGFNHHKYRFAAVPVHFDPKKYLENGSLNPKESNLIFQFDGLNPGKILI